MGRLSTALAVSAGGLAAIYVAACVLPNGPSDAGRVQFTLNFPVPYRVPLAGVVEPLVTISADGQVLKNPSYRLETLNTAVVRVDSTGRGLEGVARGTASVRVVYQTATGAPDTVFAVQVVVARVAVDSPALHFTRLGATRPLNAVAFDAKEAAVPNVAFTWSSAAPRVATVNDTGLVTAVDEGTVVITAEADSVAGASNVVVTQVASQVRVAPGIDTLHTVGRSAQFIAVAFDDSSRVLRTAKPRWSTSDASVARVDSATGLATATGAGTARITARVGTAADTATLVVAQVVRFLIVTPGFDTLTAIQDTSRVVAIASDSLGNPIPNTAVAWATSEATIATVDPTGLVTAAANGVVLVTASSGSLSAFATVVVRQEIAAARVSQDSVALTGAGDTVRLSAVAVDRNGYPVAGAEFAWSSGFDCVATVDAAGLVTARGQGKTGIVATLANGAASATAAVTVAAAPLPCGGTWIAFDSPRGIEVVRADGSARSVLLAGPGKVEPAWSADGARLAFAREFCAIYTVSPDGSDERMVTGGGGCDYSPAWSPDGTKIAFDHQCGDETGCVGSGSIWVVNADGSNPTELPGTGNDDLPHYPVWSPDGTKFAFAANSVCFQYFTCRDIYVMNADGSGVVNLTQGRYGYYSHMPAWSPDGLQLAFLVIDQIWLMNSDGSGATNLTPSLRGVHGPAWSPDGSRIVFGMLGEGGYDRDLYVINRDGTGQRQLTSTPDVIESNPAWRPGGPLP